MPDLKPTSPVDYLIVGHVCHDLTADGVTLGGTAAYSGLTAAALGLRVGLLTSTGPQADLGPLHRLEIHNLPSPATTTFENRYTPSGRQQWLHARGGIIRAQDRPAAWSTPRVIHLAPIDDEIDPSFLGTLGAAWVGITPQGWMRAWDQDGLIHRHDWRPAPSLLAGAGAVVLSLEDLSGDEAAAEALAQAVPVLVVTDGPAGARVYWNGDQRRVPAPRVDELDPTGAGDIFAACFFARLQATRDPWEAARYANFLAAASVTRSGIESVPTAAEVEAAGRQVLP